MNRLFAPDPGNSRLAASMDRLLATRGPRRDNDAAPPAIDVSRMDSLSKSMRAALPQPQRAAYDQSWAQELRIPAGAIARTSIHETPSARLAASMDCELARHGIRPG